MERLRSLRERSWTALLTISIFAIAPLGAVALPSDALEAVVPLVLRHNTDVRLAALDFQIARAEVLAGSIDFDPFLTLRPEYRDERLLSNSTLESDNYHETTGSVSLGLKRKFHFGLQAEVVIQELWLTSDSLQSTFGDRDQVAAQLKVTQPLLRGRGSQVNTSTLEKAKVKSDRYRSELRSAVNDAVVKTLGLYLDLSRARYEANLKENEANYYAVREREAIERLRLGLVSSPDELAIRARHEIAKAESALATAKALEAEEKLIREVSTEKRMALLPPLLSEEELMTISTGTIESEERRSHPMIDAAIFQSKETSVDFVKAKASLLPQLDFSFQVSSVGAGASHPEAEEGLTSGRTPSWQVNLSLVWPLENHGARSEVERLAVESKTRDLQVGRQRLEIDEQIATTKREIAKFEETFVKVHGRLHGAKELAAARQAQFQAGRLEASEFIRARNDFEEARLETIQAAVAVRKARYRILGLENRLLSVSNFEKFVETLD